MQRHAPVMVVGNDTIGKRSFCAAPLHSRQSRHAEQEAALRPQGQTRLEIHESGRAAIAHGRLDLHIIGVGLERIESRYRHLAPIANRADDGSARSTLENVHMLIAVGPCRPIVRNEVGKDHPVAADFAVLHRRDIDDGTAWHTVRDRCFDCQSEGQFFVDDRHVARRPRLIIDDWRRPHHDANGRHDLRGRQCKGEQRPQDGFGQRVHRE